MYATWESCNKKHNVQQKTLSIKLHVASKNCMSHFFFTLQLSHMHTYFFSTQKLKSCTVKIRHNGEIDNNTTLPLLNGKQWQLMVNINGIMAGVNAQQWLNGKTVAIKN